MEFRDLKAQYRVLKKEIDAAIENVMLNSEFIGGKEVRRLEESLAEYAGAKHCITCGNGTDALVLALMAWNIGEGDAVFVPDFTFFASGEAPAFLGAAPIFVDVDKETYNISPAALEAAIEKVLEDGKLVPKVIIAVDLFGQPADYPRLKEIAEKHHLLILEDGAQGFGGSIGKKRACSFGDISTTSFFPAKPLGCYGDGGAVFTDNDEWAELIRSLCVHGKGKDKYDNVRVGMNSRLDGIQAAVLNVKLKQFAEYELDKVNEIAEEYTRLLGDRVKTPKIMDGFTSSWAQYTVVCGSSEQREEIIRHLKKQEIPVMIYYAKGLHEQKAFCGGKEFGMDYPVTGELTKRVISLPMHPYMALEQVRKAAGLVLEKS